MHNGIVPNLTGLIYLFNEGFVFPLPQGLENNQPIPKKSALIRPLGLSVEKMEALEAFLQAI